MISYTKGPKTLPQTIGKVFGHKAVQPHSTIQDYSTFSLLKAVAVSLQGYSIYPYLIWISL